MFLFVHLILISQNLSSLLEDLLPVDSECDWPADELLGDHPRLLVGSHLGEAAAGSDCQNLAQILSLLVHLHDLPVFTVFGDSTCSLHR